MTLTTTGLQRFWQLRHDAVVSVTERFYATHGTVYQQWGPRGREACREDLGFHIEFLRPVLEFGLVQPMVSYLVWLREVLDARGIPSGHLAQSLRWLGDFYADHLDAPDAAAVQAAMDGVLQALAQAEQMPASPAQPDTPTAAAWPEVCEFEHALLRGNRNEAQQVVQRCLAQGHSLVSIEAHVVQPAMVRIGDGWQANRVSVAQEHMATAIAHAVITASLEQQSLPPPNGHHIILACVEGNHHALGLRMVADAFEVQGWDVTYLGANVPTRALVDMVTTEQPDLLGLSVSFPQQLGTVRDILAQLNERLPDTRPPVLVGGLAVNRFQPLAGVLGAEGHAASALDAVDVAQQLLKQPPTHGL
ncbi:MAG: cobalamin-dependent protein [Hydrogenophaga sp.]|uniref:cobalamin B12-binding domain-containing protein n=1 Tax=Hydrogenophaga sp. TaxID=1904254 RepID=UPI00277A2A1D|nr:cobalamin-dependent protein [Hydrogenophaga sp.]MDP2419299.1 cobalamin-dependent protein [Hydrogenophaga sp.]MDZ4186843.1 cobalamin-dependent protein [Hydrogenophaga sp.]